MKGFAERYLNEIVSLTVMALMAVALIAGQADAMVQNSIRSDSGFATATPDAREASELAAVRADVAIRLEFDELTRLVDQQRVKEALGDIIENHLRGDR